MPKRPSSRKLGEHRAPRQAGTARCGREQVVRAVNARTRRGAPRTETKEEKTDRMSRITVREESVMIVAR